MLTNLVKVAITIDVEMSLTLRGDEWCRFFQGLGSAGDGGGGGAIPTPPYGREGDGYLLSINAMVCILEW